MRVFIASNQELKIVSVAFSFLLKNKRNILVELSEIFSTRLKKTDTKTISLNRLLHTLLSSASARSGPDQITVLLLFVFAGLTFVVPANFTPFTLAPTAANAGGLGAVPDCESNHSRCIYQQKQSISLHCKNNSSQVRIFVFFFIFFREKFTWDGCVSQHLHHFNALIINDLPSLRFFVGALQSAPCRALVRCSSSFSVSRRFPTWRKRPRIRHAMCRTRLWPRWSRTRVCAHNSRDGPEMLITHYLVQIRWAQRCKKKFADTTR
jgi:hypothetical protein